jgi:signal transduction histidine kinase
VRGKDSGGAGLGLALARRLARSVGGDVVLEQAGPPVFAVTLPGGAAPVASAPAPAASENADPVSTDERSDVALPASGLPR